MWALQCRRRRGKNGRSHVVQQFYIPTTMVPNFIVGMQCGKERAHGLFQEIKENHKPQENVKQGPGVIAILKVCILQFIFLSSNTICPLVSCVTFFYFLIDENASTV